MTSVAIGSIPNLPDSVRRGLGDFVVVACRSLGDDLSSVVLYGSAAEGKLRATSDVNLLLVLARFDRAKIDPLREPARSGLATIRLKTMFMLESEIAPAVSAFAVKFADILHRRRVLYGMDPFETVVVPRSAMLWRLKQVLLNLTIRLRETYVLRSLREEQLVAVIADCAGPLRAAAATILELEGGPGVSPKEALARLSGSLGVADHARILARLSRAREERQLDPGEAGEELLALGDLAAALRMRVDLLPP